MDEDHLYSVMVYAGTVGKELMGSDKAAADTSAAKAGIESSAAALAPAPAATTTTTGSVRSQVSRNRLFRFCAHLDRIFFNTVYRARPSVERLFLRFYLLRRNPTYKISFFIFF